MKPYLMLLFIGSIIESHRQRRTPLSSGDDDVLAAHNRGMATVSSCQTAAAPMYSFTSPNVTIAALTAGQASDTIDRGRHNSSLRRCLHRSLPEKRWPSPGHQKLGLPELVD